ncbi:MAG: twin-arginine translocation signal domain-containing protein [Sphingomonas sp.]
MSEVPVPPQWSFSRRGFLKTVGIGGVVLGAGLTSTPAQAKMGQKAAAYRATPKGNQRCDNCALWRAPSSCLLVESPIVPSGWCNLYRAK